MVRLTTTTLTATVKDETGGTLLSMAIEIPAPALPPAGPTPSALARDYGALLTTTLPAQR